MTRTYKYRRLLSPANASWWSRVRARLPLRLLQRPESSHVSVLQQPSPPRHFSVAVLIQIIPIDLATNVPLYENNVYLKHQTLCYSQTPLFSLREFQIQILHVFLFFSVSHISSLVYCYTYIRCLLYDGVEKSLIFSGNKANHRIYLQLIYDIFTYSLATCEPLKAKLFTSLMTLYSSNLHNKMESLY